MSLRYTALYLPTAVNQVVQPDPVVITLSVVAPTATVRAKPDPLTITPSVQTPAKVRHVHKAQPDPLTITLSVQIPLTTVRAKPDPLTITLSVQVPSLNGGQFVFPDSSILTATLVAPTARVKAKPSPVVITASVVTPTATYNAVVRPDPLVIALSVAQPSVKGGYRSTVLSPLSISLSIAPPAIITSPAGVSLSSEDFDTSFKQVRYEVVLTGHHASLDNVLIPTSTITIQRYITETGDPVVVPAASGVGPLTKPLGGYAFTDNLGTVWTSKELYDLDYKSTAFQNIAISPVDTDLMFMGSTNRTVKRSTDGGQTWENVSLPETGSVFAAVQHVICDPNNTDNVLAFVAGEGFFRSTDQGQTFAALPPLGNGLAISNTIVPFVSYHPTESGRLYLLARNSGGTTGYLLRSIDGGQTWASIQSFSGDTYGVLKSLHFTATLNTFFLATSLGSLVYKTTDGGVTWTASNSGINTSPGPAGHAFAGSPSDSDTMYLFLSRVNPSPVFSYWEIYQTTDGGANWTLRKTGNGVQLFTPYMAVDPSDPDTVVVAMQNQDYGGTVFSTDGGANWTLKNTGLPWPNQAPSRLLFSPDGSRLHYVNLRNLNTSLTYGYQVVDTIPRLRGTTRADLIIPAPPATMQAVADRAVVVDGEKAQLIIREVKERADGSRRYYTLTRGNLINLRINWNPRKKDLVLSLEEEVYQRPITTDPRTISLSKIIGIDNQDSTSVSLSGIVTDYELYDRVVVDGEEFTVTTIQYRLSPRGRYTDLSNNQRTAGNQGDIGTFVTELDELGEGVITRGTFGGRVYNG